MDNNILPKFCLFASGSGSNAANLATYSLQEGLPLAFCVTDREDAGVIEKMQKLQIPCHIIPRRKGQTKEEHEAAISNFLFAEEIEWIFLAGYMRILSSSFLSKFYSPNFQINRIVNIHPSLLPAFPGAHGYKDAFEYGVQRSGVTIHFVDDGMDTGPIIFQESFERCKGDTLETFSQRGLALEHQVYPKVLGQIIKGDFSVSNLSERQLVTLGR